MKEKDGYKFVSLVGELADLGNHILMPFGITLCGMPTTDVDKNEFPALKERALSDMVFEYKEEELNVTCKKCLEMIDILEKANQIEKNKKN